MDRWSAELCDRSSHRRPRKVTLDSAIGEIYCPLTCFGLPKALRGRLHHSLEGSSFSFRDEQHSRAMRIMHPLDLVCSWIARRERRLFTADSCTSIDEEPHSAASGRIECVSTNTTGFRTTATLSDHRHAFRPLPRFQTTASDDWPSSELDDTRWNTPNWPTTRCPPGD